MRRSSTQKRKWTRENPVKGVAIPSDKDAVRIQVVTAEEEKQYFRRARKNLALYDLGRLMLNQGVRPDEALSLGKADVDLENGRIFIRDGKSSAARRTLDLTSESKLILAKRMKVTPGGYSLQNGSGVCTLAGSTVRTTVC